jgi:large subunit ribosomal protein L7/L12
MAAGVPRLTSLHSRGLSTDAEPASDRPTSPKDPKVADLVDQIASLSLLEAAELTDALKARLGITTTAVAMPMGGGGAAAPAAAAEEAAPVAEKTHFTVKLDKFDAGSKIKLIKEVRAVTGLGLKEAKELVEGAPADIKADVLKADAEALKEKLEGVGGTITLE